MQTAAKPALCLLLLTAACNQSGTAPLGEPLDQLAGFAGVPTMQPGADCLHCHSAGGAASDRIWTAAGTVYPSVTACAADGGVDGPDSPGCLTGVQGVQVLLTDSNDQELTLTTNSAGNFYTDQPLGTLTSIMVQNGSHRMVMNMNVVGGGDTLVGLSGGAGVSCNYCHTGFHEPPIRGIGGAPGSLFVPGD